MEVARKQVTLLQGIILNLLTLYEPQSIPHYFPGGAPNAALATTTDNGVVSDAAQASTDDDDSSDFTDGSSTDSPQSFYTPDANVSDNVFSNPANGASTTIAPHLDPAVLQGRRMVVGAPLAASLMRARLRLTSNLMGARRRRRPSQASWTTFSGRISSRCSATSSQITNSLNCSIVHHAG